MLFVVNIFAYYHFYKMIMLGLNVCSFTNATAVQCLTYFPFVNKYVNNDVININNQLCYTCVEYFIVLNSIQHWIFVLISRAAILLNFMIYLQFL